MAIAAILIGAMGGAIAITTRAIDGGEDRNARASRAIDAAGVIAEDLRTATAVTATGGSSVEMILPDRDADGSAERVRYSWGGTSGASIRSTYNNTTTELLGDVRSFSVSTRTRDVPAYSTPSATLFDATSYASGVYRTDFVVGSAGAIGQYVLPTLSAGAVQYTVTSIRTPMQRESSADGVLLVSVYEAGPGGLPSSRLIAYKSILESSLSGGTTWTTITFPSCEPVEAGRGVVITFTSISSLVALVPGVSDEGFLPGGLPGLTVGAGGLGDLLKSTTGSVAGVVNGLVSGASPNSRDACRLERCYYSSGLDYRRRLSIAANGTDYGVESPGSTLRFQLDGQVTIRNYGPGKD